MTANKIRVGIAVALSGRYADLGRQVLAGLRCYIADTNSAGGIRFGAGGERAMLELVVADDQSEPRVVRQRVHELIERERVDLLMGPYGSGPTRAATEIAEANGVVLWNHSGSADRLFERGYKFQVGLISPASAYLRSVLDALHAADPDARRVALLSARTGFATDMAAGVRQWLEKAGFEACMDLRYATGSQDFGALLRTVGAAPPDWLLGVGRVEDDLVLARALCDARLSIKAAALVAAGIEQFDESLAVRGEGFLAPSQWEATAGYRVDCGPDAQTFVQRYQAANGEAPDYPAAQGYAGGLIAGRVVEKARSLDQSVLRACAADLRCTTLYGPFQIDHNGLQVAHRILVTQWQQRRRRVVWPLDSAVTNLNYPAPPS